MIPVSATLGMRFIFVVFPEHYSAEKGYVVFTAHEDMLGLHPTNLHWGHDYDLAFECAYDLNILMGHTVDSMSYLAHKRRHQGVRL